MQAQKDRDSNQKRFTTAAGAILGGSKLTDSNRGRAGPG